MAMNKQSRPVIEAQNLAKHFGSVSALSGVSLSVEPGQIYGFLGPNGAGKTTTIRCLMGFIRPDTGIAKVLGEPVDISDNRLKNRIGYLASDTAFYPAWNGHQHASYMQSVRQIGIDYLPLAKRLGLDMATKARKLSTGNKQKLALLLALMHDPELLILDEPTRGLDPLLQRELYSILRELRDRGRTIFMSSHNLSEVQEICDEVGIIKSGKIVASDTLLSLRKLQTHVINLTFAEPFDVADFKLPNVEINHANKTSLVVSATGDLNPLLRILPKYMIADIDINHASLEEVFMRYYND
jgi:ABC-2 type transport system ATP-binding protein